MWIKLWAMRATRISSRIEIERKNASKHVYLPEWWIMFESHEDCA